MKPSVFVNDFLLNADSNFRNSLKRFKSKNMYDCLENLRGVFNELLKNGFLPVLFYYEKLSGKNGPLESKKIISSYNGKKVELIEEKFKEITSEKAIMKENKRVIAINLIFSKKSENNFKKANLNYIDTHFAEIVKAEKNKIWRNISIDKKGVEKFFVLSAGGLSREG